MRRHFLTALTAMLLLAVVGMPAYTETEVSFAEVEQRMAEEVVAFINAERVAAGLNPLAVWHTNEFAVRSNEDYRDTGEAHRIFSEVAADYPPGTRVIGENQGPRGVSGEQVVGWRRSPDHNANQLRPESTHIAVAVSCRADTGTAAMTAQFITSREPQGSTPVAESAATSDAGTSCADAFPASGHSMDGVVTYLPWVGGGLVALLVLSFVSTVADRRKQRTMEQQAAAQVANERQTGTSSNRGMAQVIDDLTP